MTTRNLILFVLVLFIAFSSVACTDTDTSKAAQNIGLNNAQTKAVQDTRDTASSVVNFIHTLCVMGNGSACK
jgi:hypothetical protein